MSDIVRAEGPVAIDQFLDEAGRITRLPAKTKPRAAVLAHLAGKFDPARDYTEKEVNALCDAWHTFGDYFVLRRGLVDCGLLGRERDGSRYWRVLAGERGEGGGL